MTLKGIRHSPLPQAGTVPGGQRARGLGAVAAPRAGLVCPLWGVVPASLTAAFLTSPSGGRSGFWPLGGRSGPAFCGSGFLGWGHGPLRRPGCLWSLFPPGLQPWARRSLETLGT